MPDRDIVTASWGGDWVARHFGLQVTDSGRSQPALRELVGVALRRNPRRAHLLVSSVLGKHVPTDPRTVHESGLALGSLVADCLAGARADDGENPVVIGYAETATALGHCVAEQLRADYLHSTRRALSTVRPFGEFEEPHSHATGHLLLPEDRALLTRPGPVVLVDDELSTGRTALNTVAALHALTPHDRYVIASLVDLRGPAEQAALAVVANDLGVRIDTVSLAAGTVSWPADFADQAWRYTQAWSPPTAPAGGRAGEIVDVPAEWPAAVRDGARHGATVADTAGIRTAAAALADALADRLAGPASHDGPRRTLVLGFEELMYAPLLLALELARSVDVRFSSTTRSPVLAVDEPGYPIRTRLVFASHDEPADGPGQRYAYNVAPPAGQPGYSDIVLVIDDVADTHQLHAPGGLLAELAAVCARLHLVRLPSYRPASDAS